MMVTLTARELSAPARAEVAEFVATRFPGFTPPEDDTRIRITENRVEFRIVRDSDNVFDSTVAHMMMTPAISDALVDLLAANTVNHRSAS